ncbi:MAG: hypothetical protein M1831_004127 [Alyxoria varia]|nr:MAG: hypothetical protein M1831_004127 [Alyxoria varia]
MDSQAPSTPVGLGPHRPVYLDDDDDLGIPTFAPTAKSQSAKVTPGRQKRPIDLTGDDTPTKSAGNAARKAKRSPKNAKGKKDADAREKRARRWRSKAPVSYSVILERAQTQRMFVIERKNTESTPDEPEQTVEIAGTTGNLYKVVVNHVPSCTCPHAVKGNQCKHIVYVMHHVLKAPSELQYQLALTTPELHTIFSKAPPLPQDAAKSQAQASQGASASTGATLADGEDSDCNAPIHESFAAGNRKPIEDDCPICCTEFPSTRAEQKKQLQAGSILYCKAACGNNVHRECFLQWASVQRSKGERDVTCPFCRTAWEWDKGTKPASGRNKAPTTWKEGDDIDRTNVTMSGDGYLNVAGQLGLSGLRDYSGYHRPWLSRMRREGRVEDEDEYTRPYW